MEFLTNHNHTTHSHHRYRHLEPLLDYTPSTYIPEPYTAPNSISATHNQPRYGHTNDFETLIDGGEDATRDYITGIIIGALIILSVAVVWFLAIVILKCMGEKKVGFLAGRLIRHTATTGSSSKGEGVEVVMPSPSNPEDGIDEGVPVNHAIDTETEQKFTRSVHLIRAIFILSAIVVIISGGVFYGKGVVSFKNSIDEVRLGIDLVQTAARKTIDLTENVIQAEGDIEEELVPTAQVEQENNGEICGLNSEVSAQVRTVYVELTKNVDLLKEMVEGSLASFSHDLKNLITLTEKVDSGLDQADIFFYILITISVVLIGLIVAMLVGVFFAWKGVSNCVTKAMQYAIIWPLFIFFLVLSWLFATLFLIASLAGSDFCVNPDKNTQAILGQDEDEFQGIFFGFVIFYVSGCTIQPAGEEEIIALASQARVVLEYAHDLTELLGEVPIAGIVALCGLTIQQATAVKKFVNFSHDVTHLLNRAIVGLREVLACETFNPIYTTFVHKALCIEGVSGLKSIFTTTLIISIFSMIMIMFRAALYPIKEPDVKLASSDENAMEVAKYNEDSPGEKDAGDEQVVVY